MPHDPTDTIRGDEPGPISRSVVLRDTTLREGIQIPGSDISLDQKRRFISRLEEVGVPEIEVGLPDGVSACGELADFVRQRDYRIQTTALVPCYTVRWKRQVDLAAERGVHRIDILTPTSDSLLRNTAHYGMQPEEILPRVLEVAAYARKAPLELSVACMDATRAPLERLLIVVEALADAGVSRLTIYDSVGVAVPSQMTALITRIREVSPLPILVHCHNDYGMATANSLAAVEAGARAVDVAVNGLGGRAGNAALEEVALALENLYGLETGIDLAQLRQLAQLAQEMTGLRIWPLKPVVGDFCFAHLPVMHIRCIAGGNPSAFEPFPPEQVGAERSYAFSLPVDYTAALEPFFQKCGRAVDSESGARLLALLRAPRGKHVWTEEEILRLIRKESTQ